ncbi:MAG: hypothetical protein OSJ74_05295 [Clostridia bacterium]|nr:hypothetical protein [Clostridia bacterium]
MKKNKAILLISIILVVAMVLALAVGCQNNNNDQDSSLGSDNNKVGSALIDNAHKGITFTVLSDSAVSNAADLISVVKTTTKESVDAEVVAEGKGRYVVYPPTGFYTIGDIYKITIDKSLRFDGYNENVKEIIFTVTQDLTNSVQYVDGVLSFDKARMSGKFEHFAKRENSEQQEIFGSFNLQANGAEVNKGDVILIEDAKNGLQEAYKVEECKRIDSTLVGISYVKPQMVEVYDEFTVEEARSMDAENDEIEFIYEEIAESVENSELAQAAVSFFGAKPTFSFDVKKVDDAIKAKITMTIPSVVAIDDFKTDLVIEFDCTIKVNALVNVDLEGNEVDAGVIAYVYNKVDTTIKLQSGYSFADVTNLTELIEKTAQMQDAEAGVSAPLFTWILPIANGAVSVRYQCDLTFSFAFAGSFGVTISSDFNYMLGATYDKVEGVKTFADKLEGSGVKSVEVDLSGSAKMKLGLANTLSLDVLAGVLGLGIKAEVGNFNGLYGFMNTGNLLAEEVSVSGAVYFEGGFYYDIDLLLALSIGKVANISIGDLSKAIDITQGEIVLYKAGEESVITDIVGGNTIVLSAKETKLPEYDAFAYNLKNRGNTYATKVTLEDSVWNGKYLNIENGKVTVIDPSEKFEQQIELEYLTSYGKVIKVKTTFVYDGTVHMDKADFDYDKSGNDNMKNLEIKLSGTMVDDKTDEVVSADVEGATYDVNFNVLTIPYEALAAMENGTHSIAIRVNNAVCYASVTVTGTASALGYNLGDEYYIFTAEQVANMSDSSIDYAGKKLVLKNDIDMNGAVINPIGVFNGSLDGNGYTISNYTVEGMYDNNVAFIAINNGTVKNLTLAGDVNAVIAAKTRNDYKVAGVVAVNNGTLSNVNITGAVNVESTTLNAFVTIKVMASVAEGNTDGVSADVTIKAVSKFDIANVTFYIDGSVDESKVEKSCTNAAVKDGALVKFVKI